MNSFLDNVREATGKAGAETAKKIAMMGTMGSLNGVANGVANGATFDALDPTTYVTVPVANITNTLYSNASSFYQFLIDNKIVASTIGIVVGLQMNGLWSAITDDIINPITKKIMHKDVEDLSFCIGGVTFYYGKIMNGLINILISFFFLYKLYELSKSFGLK
jgi:large-conductance mechanosensitive channel